MCFASHAIYAEYQKKLIMIKYRKEIALSSVHEQCKTKIVT